MTPTPDVLGPPLSKGAARSLETQARRHYKAAARNLIQFCADLRQLQDGGAHFVRGFDNFGAYAEHVFDGISAAAAKQLSRQGHVALVLQRHGRISLAGHGRDLPGTTGLRALASVLNQHGEAVMLDVYDRAKAARPDRAIVAETVTRAVRDLMATKTAELAPGDDDDEPEEEAGYADEPEDDDLEDDEPEAVHELRDRLTHVREALNDLSIAVGAGLGPSVRRAYDELVAEVTEVGEALRAAESGDEPEAPTAAGPTARTVDTPEGRAIKKGRLLVHIPDPDDDV